MTPPYHHQRSRGSRTTRGRRCGVLAACALAALALGLVAYSASSPAPTFTRALMDSDDGVDVEVGDLNGDGKDDVVVANFNPATVGVWLHGGAGKSYDVGGLAIATSIRDLNGDGRPDLVAVTEALDAQRYPVAVLLNDGTGRFGSATRVLADSGRISIGDVTGDGRPEIVSVDPASDQLSVAVNRGDGTYASARSFATGSQPSEAAIGDLDGDGNGDLAVANSGGASLSVLLSKGEGTFSPRVDYPTGRHPLAPVLEDLDGDGAPEVVVANHDQNSVAVFVNRGDGTLDARRDYPTGKGPESLAVRDLNGDGKPDLLSADRTAKAVSVLLNDGAGSFRARSDYRTSGDASVKVVRDVNGDGSTDVATVNGASETISLLLNRGDGSFRPKLDYAPSLSFGLYRSSLALGDLNDDRRLDLVVPVVNGRNGWSYLAVLLNRPGRCNVQRLGGLTVAAAKHTLARVNCRAGKVRRVHSNWVAKGRVVGQKPRFGAERPAGTKVDLVVSKGPWR